MSGNLRFDYTAVGHVTVDVLADGSRRPGGGALYSAVQASRLGRRTRLVTQGEQDELERMLEPFAGEFTLEILPSVRTTTLATRGIGAERAQQMLAWAGEMGATLAIDTDVLHLAPVARETPSSWRGESAFVGLTAQGLVRRWDGADGAVEPAPASVAAQELAERCDALVISVAERESCATLLERARGAGALTVITAGAGPNVFACADGSVRELAVPPLADVRDDLGAGDVFAAALFVALTEGREIADANSFANGAAAVRMQGRGAQAIGDRDAIAARLDRTGTNG